MSVYASAARPMARTLRARPRPAGAAASLRRDVTNTVPSTDRRVPLSVRPAGGLGEQRRPGEEAAVHPRGRGGRRGAEPGVARLPLPAAPRQGAQLAAALPAPDAETLPRLLRALALPHPADTGGQLLQRAVRAQSQVEHARARALKGVHAL